MSNDIINFINEPIFQSFNLNKSFTLSVSILPKALNTLAYNLQAFKNKNINSNYTNDINIIIKRIFNNSKIGEIHYINQTQYLDILYFIMNYCNVENYKKINNNIIEKLKIDYKEKTNIFVYYYLFIYFSKINQYKFIRIEEILDLYEILKKNVQFSDDEKKEKIINSICGEFLSIVLNFDDIEKFIDNDLIFLLTIYSFERDIFNGIFDLKYELITNYFKKYKKFLNNDNEEYKSIINKYCKYSLLENSKILEEVKVNPKYTLNDFITIKKKYENFMENFFKFVPYNIEDLNNIQTSLLFIFDKQYFDEISLNTNEYSILLEYFNYNYYEFYDKLMICLLFLLKTLKYPIIKITNTFLILLDLIHLNKKTISYKFLQKFILLIEEFSYNQGIINKIFQIPILILKLLIFLHDMWDILIDKKIPYYYKDYYQIKDLFDFLYEQLKIFKISNDSLKFLYYSFLLKKASRKINWTKNEYEAKKYYLNVYFDLKYTQKKNSKLKILYDYSRNKLINLENKLRIKLIKE